VSFSAIDGLVWFLAFLVPLLIVQRKLHWELQAFLLLLLRNPSIALALFSFLFFPGVLLHETSHYLMAHLLRVRTGKFSLIPAILPNGQLRLGYVETAQSDFLRDSLIGTAPLIAGGAVIVYLSLHPLGLLPLAGSAYAGQWEVLSQQLAVLPSQPDFWLWFYLAFAVSSTMLPSASDRQSWLPLVLVVAFLIGFAAIGGAGPWMVVHVAPWSNNLFRVLAAVFGISFLFHTVLLFPTWFFRVLLSKVTGLSVVE
jgi:hypothetical protein